jgi:hypothetical protein
LLSVNVENSDWNDPTSDWIIEGTSVAAELSTTATMLLSRDYSERNITASFPYGDGDTRNGRAEFYQAQDFWVFVGQDRGRGIEVISKIGKRLTGSGYCCEEKAS